MTRTLTTKLLSTILVALLIVSSLFTTTNSYAESRTVIDSLRTWQVFPTDYVCIFNYNGYEVAIVKTLTWGVTFHPNNPRLEKAKSLEKEVRQWALESPENQGKIEDVLKIFSTRPQIRKLGEGVFGAFGGSMHDTPLHGLVAYYDPYGPRDYSSFRMSPTDVALEPEDFWAKQVNVFLLGDSFSKNYVWTYRYQEPHEKGTYNYFLFAKVKEDEKKFTPNLGESARMYSEKFRAKAPDEGVWDFFIRILEGFDLYALNREAEYLGWSYRCPDKPLPVPSEPDDGTVIDHTINK